MYLGVDLGTSSVKAVVIDDKGAEVASAATPLSVSRPHAGWSEQDPDTWVSAAESAVCQLPSAVRGEVQAIGFSGQMHGATLLGKDDRVLRPAILWNDARSSAECVELEEREPQLRAIVGNKAMPGFTAPKLLWVQKHEPEIFGQTAKILLPKDYLRLVWTGEYASDVSDASGTLWLDTSKRQWSDQALAGCNLTKAHMPALYESPEITGTLLPDVAGRLGLEQIPVVAGAGDQAAGAVGSGVTEPGEAVLALGTSGVIFRVTDAFAPNADAATHAFCHAVPDRWHQMAVLLSAASAVDWTAKMCGYASPAEAYQAAESCGNSSAILFYPYLTGERTPHDLAVPAGAFLGMSAADEPAHMLHAALEGVAFAFADGKDVLEQVGDPIEQASVVGGGARSGYWGQMLSNILGIPLHYRSGAEAGPALGAARLALLGATGRDVGEVCRPNPIKFTIEPDSHKVELYAEKLAHWRALFAAMRPHILERQSQ